MSSKISRELLLKILYEPDVMSFVLERKIQWTLNLEKAPWWRANVV